MNHQRHTLRRCNSLNLFILSSFLALKSELLELGEGLDFSAELLEGPDFSCSSSQLSESDSSLEASELETSLSSFGSGELCSLLLDIVSASLSQVSFSAVLNEVKGEARDSHMGKYKKLQPNTA